MMWILGAVSLGIVLGVLGYYYSKTAYSLFLTSLVSFAFLSSYAKGLMNQSQYVGEGPAIPMDENGMTNPIGLLNLIFKSVDNMGALPQHIQLALVIFILTFFLARIATWFYTKMGIKPAAVETKAERKARILKEYGYTDGLPY